jgi:hypothetical protein
MIAHEPERAPAPATAVDPLARLALLAVFAALLLDGLAHVYQYLHYCFIENVMWFVVGDRPVTVWQCVAETTIWLPAMLRHLVK